MGFAHVFLEIRRQEPIFQSSLWMQAWMQRSPLSAYRILSSVSLFGWYKPDGAFAIYSFLSHQLLLYWVGVPSECNGIEKGACCLGKCETA